MAGAFSAWAMIEAATSTVVGDIGFLGPPRGDGMVELGYSVVPSRRRRGYASEAAGAIVRWALAQPGVSAVEAETEADNEASQRVLRRVGFRCLETSSPGLRWRADRATTRT